MTEDTNPPTKALSIQASRSLNLCNQPFNDVVRQAADAGLQADPVQDSRDILQAQSHVLDAVFHRLLTKALTSNRSDVDPKYNYIDKGYMDFALRAQRQCRSTVEALQSSLSQKSANELKAP